MGSPEEVAAAAQALNGRVVFRLSSRPLSAEAAVPRLTTLAQTVVEPESSEPSAGSSVQVVVGHLTMAKKEIKKEIQEDHLQTKEEVIANPVHERVFVKEEEVEAMSSEPSSNSSVHVAVGHFQKVKKENLKFRDQPPWKRRAQLQEADVVG